MIGAVILAAGAGARMGGVAKALLPRGETTFLGAIVRAAAAAGVTPGAIVIVVGAPHGDAIAREAARLALAGHVIWNDDPARGMASSVALGFAALAARADASVHAALLWPVDHPAVRATTIDALADALGDADAAVPSHAAAKRGRAEDEGRAEGASAEPSTRGPGAAPRAAAEINRGGHPALIARGLWPRLAACGDSPDGARGVLRAARVVRVPVDDPGVVRDVDVPADLAGLA